VRCELKLKKQLFFKKRYHIAQPDGRTLIDKFNT
jgi:hypothetical protein